jgi:hypothetical protein
MTTSVMCTQPTSPDPGFLAGLPGRSRLELGPYEEAPRTARGHIARVLEEWSLAKFHDVTVLIASELITNSLREIAKYSWAILPPIRIWLRGGPPGVAIFVWDAVNAAPAPRVAQETEESGRGLAIVAELSAACGYYQAADLGGKVTWAAITTA